LPDNGAICSHAENCSPPLQLRAARIQTKGNLASENPSDNWLAAADLGARATNA
jgi:hypothetical protein